jgi:biotin carboxylase
MSTVQSSVTAPGDPEIAGRRLLVLGGGLWQREYVRHSRALGAEVWLTDWSASAVARPDAHHFAPIDLRDREGTLAYARKAGVEAVMTAADIGVPTAAYVAEALRLPGAPVTVAEQATNKWAMRKQAEAIGLRCPWFVRVTTSQAALDAVTDRGFPVIVKPVDNCSSRGVQVVDHADLLASAVEQAREASLAGEVLIEQFLEGREGSIEAFVQDGDTVVLGVCDKTKSRLPDRFDLELRYPGTYSAETWRQIESFVATLVRGFGIRQAILHIEFLVADADGPVYLIEFALRGCGSKVVTHLLPAITGIDVVRAVVRQAFGLRTDVRIGKRLHGALHFLLFPPGRITAVDGVDAARALPGVIDLTIERQAGETITTVHDGRSRPGHLLVCAETREAVQQLIRDARERLSLDYEDRLHVPPVPMQDAAA